jgi:bifunctional DNA primase/polymerase-like protein
VSYPTNRRLLRLAGLPLEGANTASTTPRSFTTAAMALAEMGIPVFPAATNKRPLPEHGFKDASADPAVVRELWRRWPGL